MRAVVQRVSQASVETDGRVNSLIEKGLLVYLGVERDDDDTDATYLSRKIRHLRVFPDADHRLHLDVMQARGAVLVVSAFTLQADARRGRRPAFPSAATPERARRLYEKLCETLAQTGLHVARGSFGDTMKIHSINDGPVCILLDSHRLF